MEGVWPWGHLPAACQLWDSSPEMGAEAGDEPIWINAGELHQSETPCVAHWYKTMNTHRHVPKYSERLNKNI